MTCVKLYDNMNVRNGGVIIPTKTIAFRVEEQFHTLVKIQATKEGKTLQEHVIEVLQHDLDKKSKMTIDNIQ